MIPQYEMDGLGGEYLVTQKLEQDFAQFFGVKHCVLLTSGTVALLLALRAVGAKKVAIPPLTMFGSASAAELAGCDIVFVSGTDIPKDVDTYMHVSLNGRACDIEEIKQKNPHVTIVEDACQSFGSQVNGKYLGTFGTIGCFSFSPHKIISAGNGGCIVTNDDELASRVRKLKNFGRETGGADFHEEMGYNFKFTDIQASFMRPQFDSIASRLSKKVALYDTYYKKLSHIMRPHAGVPWFIDIYVQNRAELAAYLKERGIGTRGMYPLVSTQKPFADRPVFGDTSLDAKYSQQGLWLPSSLSLTDEQVQEVIAGVQAWK